jgi:hypothetical protein
MVRSIVFSNSVWSAPPPARWGNLVLSIAFSPMRLAQPSTMSLLWEVGLLLHPHSQPLLLFLVHWEFGSLPHPHSLGQVQHSTPPLLLVLDYNCCFWFSVLFGGCSISTGTVLDYVPRECVGLCMWCMLLMCWVCRFTQAALKLVSGEKCCVALLKADTSWDWAQYSGA